uniref:Uncharacterized protein n=1 Tax=Zea mays TaxID=4577 RepID=A0A804NJ61_MAIZE
MYSANASDVIWAASYNLNCSILADNILQVYYTCIPPPSCGRIKYRNMTPEAALDHVRSIRPRVLLAPSQWSLK